jgi:hypothetical protein
MLVIRGGIPAEIAVQVPTMPETAQLEQPSVQALLQQTPSVQMPETQSPAALHISPLASLSPQWLFCWMQVTPAAQSALLVQVPRQLGLFGSQT